MIIVAVKRAMEREGWSQSALAEKAGVPRPNLNAFLNGKGTLTVESVERLMRVLGLRVVAQSEKRKTKSENGEAEGGA